MLVASRHAPSDFSFRIGQELLDDQGRRLQPPLHSSGSHGYCILGAGVYHLAGEAIEKRYVSLPSCEKNTTLKRKQYKQPQEIKYDSFDGGRMPCSVFCRHQSLETGEAAQYVLALKHVGRD